MPRKAKGARKPKEFVFRAWFIAQLRNASIRYPPHYQAENEAKEVYYIPSKSGKPRRRVRFTCVKCLLKFSKKEIIRDHIDPVIDPSVGFPITLSGEDDWNAYIKRMYVAKTSIQMLCKACHNLKSKQENTKRK